MKQAMVFSQLLATLALTHVSATPMDKVVQLLGDVKARIVADGAAEQKSYDTYACWCEETLGLKAKDITDGKTSIEEITTLIVKTRAGQASHNADIAQLKKQISANAASQREAEEMRTKESSEYGGEKTQSENCIGALEAAIKVLSGAGATKKGFLETLQEAQLLGVVAGIKGVLKTSEVSHHFSDADISAVRKFADSPEEYVRGRAVGVSAAQIANNPFGDFAPQSTQIQGILKGMYDSFTADLEKDNADEAEKQKSFQALMETKKAEGETLAATLQQQELNAAEATKTLADSKATLDDTKVALDADEAFFTTTKESCQTKASQWAQRTRLRTEELAGIAQAVAIMSSPEAQATFKNASTTLVQQKRAFLQLATNAPRTKAYERLQMLAVTYKSVALAKIAVAIKTNGHFDKIISSIDTMVGILRQEAAEDIQHRDRCEAKQNANNNAKEDLDNDITKAKESIDRMDNSKIELEKKFQTIKDDIKGTEKSKQELLELRSKETADFKQALKNDAEAVALISQAIASLNKFYSDNRAALLQRAEPQSAPETTWQDGNYGGAKSQTGGVVAILEMLKEDLVKEMETGKADDSTAQAAYEKDNAGLRETLEAQQRKKVDTETALAEMGVKIQDAEEDKSGKSNDLDAEKQISDALSTDCAWVKSTFKTRAEKRKLELDGLVDAKNFLAGVDSGAPVLPP